jgi:hypothetical protein
MANPFGVVGCLMFCASRLRHRRPSVRIRSCFVISYVCWGAKSVKSRWRRDGARRRHGCSFAFVVVEPPPAPCSSEPLASSPLFFASLVLDKMLNRYVSLIAATVNVVPRASPMRWNILVVCDNMVVVRMESRINLYMWLESAKHMIIIGVNWILAVWTVFSFSMQVV